VGYAEKKKQDLKGERRGSVPLESTGTEKVTRWGGSYSKKKKGLSDSTQGPRDGEKRGRTGQRVKSGTYGRGTRPGSSAATE